LELGFEHVGENFYFSAWGRGSDYDPVVEGFTHSHQNPKKEKWICVDSWSLC
jgi:hypothetical protein